MSGGELNVSREGIGDGTLQDFGRNGTRQGRIAGSQGARGRPGIDRIARAGHMQGRTGAPRKRQTDAVQRYPPPPTYCHHMALRFACLDPSIAWELHEDKSIAAPLDDGIIGFNRCWDTAIVKQRHVDGAFLIDCSHIDSDAAYAECFFGRLKRVFRILRDDAFLL